VLPLLPLVPPRLLVPPRWPGAPPRLAGGDLIVSGTLAHCSGVSSACASTSALCITSRTAVFSRRMTLNIDVASIFAPRFLSCARIELPSESTRM
jgi:hypothetical protein